MHHFGYAWPCQQNWRLDNLTSFIYKEPRYWMLAEHLQGRVEEADFEYTLAYARCRWINYHSARGVEQIFCEHPSVEPYIARHRLVDFTIAGEAFDLKTTCFPATYAGGFEETKKNPEYLLRWLYRHQSLSGRYHTANRLFVVLHAVTGPNWRLKAELGLIRSAVEAWLKRPRVRRLYLLNVGAVRSGVIWVEA